MADNDSRAGTRYADQHIRDYLDRVHAAHDDALQAAFSAPGEHSGIPAIMVGPSEGRLLELLLRMVAAERVVEVGTLAGYSAIRMAAALPATGRLWTLEYDATHAEVARANIARAGHSDRVTVMEGAALDLLPSLEQHGPFDAVFIDADKGGYLDYVEQITPRLRSGGLLLVDNTLWYGRVVDGSDDSPNTVAIREFNRTLADDSRYEVAVTAIGDGFTLARKR